MPKFTCLDVVRIIRAEIPSGHSCTCGDLVFISPQRSTHLRLLSYNLTSSDKFQQPPRDLEGGKGYQWHN